MQFSGKPYVPEFVEVNRIENPQKTFFFERQDGSIFSTGEQNAFQCRKKFRLVGSSDGKTHQKIIMEFINTIPIDANGRRLVGMQVAKDILKKAFEAEVEVARGNTTEPREKKLLYSEGGVTERDIKGFM